MKYTVKEVRPWKVEPRNGRHAYSLTFEEASNEPVDYFSASEPKAGDIVEGSIKASEKGRMTFYEPFKLDRHQANIMSQWAVRLGYEHAADHTNKDEVRGIADMALDIALQIAEERSE